MKTPRRRRTESAAVKYLNENVTLPRSVRSGALREIRAAKQPMTVARRFVRDYSLTATGSVDFSDVQELKVKILRKHGVVDTAFQMGLNRLDRMILAGCDRREFNRVASIILNMPCVLPKSERVAPQGASTS